MGSTSRRIAPAIAAALLAAAAGAQGFELVVSGPDFTIVVPRLPAIRLQPLKEPAAPGTQTLSGGDGTYEISLLVEPTERETSTRACAGAFLRALTARPGMPARDNIYRAPLDAETFLVLYILGAPKAERLHAHLLSSANATHCVELHVSKALRDGEDEDVWRRSFQGSHVEARRR
jgi:hypothetical protein